MLADSHCHLDEFSDAAEQVERAKLAGVKAIVTNSVDLKSMRKNLELAEKFSSVSCALAIHPNELSGMTPEQIDEAFSFMEKNAMRCSAIGETGLDFKCASDAQKKIQIEVFERHIELAKKLGKPLIVHSRAARSICIEILEKHDAEKVLMHWFIASDALLSKVLGLGFFVSIGPAVLFNEHVQRFAKKVPIENLLLETDAPVSYNGKKAEPCWIRPVSEKISELLGVSQAEIEAKTWRNFEMLFSKART